MISGALQSFFNHGKVASLCLAIILSIKDYDALLLGKAQLQISKDNIQTGPNGVERIV
jgi:hypothetical protein